MRRIALTAGILAALAAPAQALAAPAKVVLTSCEPGKRAAQFEARMGEVAGSARLKMRFTLQARTPGQKAYRRVAAPGFQSWSTARPGARRWVFTRRVEALIGPARYRAVVRFRWLDARGKVLAAAKRYSGGCRQPDHRPNLKVKQVTRQGKHRYVALVVNDGRSASGRFDLQLAVADALLAPVSVAGLEPGAQRQVTLRGPRCASGATFTVTADPLDAIDERVETDNVFTAPCA